MLEVIPKTAALIASAHWSLVAFAGPVLATSDLPVTSVPLLAGPETAPVHPLPATGLLGTEEFRFPLDPETALVCTWLDEPDGSPVIAGTHDLAASLNRAAIAQADAEWFYRPGRRPTTITPTNFAPEGCAPVGRLLLPGYGAGHVRGSRRLLETKRNMEKMVEDGPSDRVVIAKVAPAP